MNSPFVEKEYTFTGIVKLIDEPFKVLEKDYDGNSRYVYKFPLKLIENFQANYYPQERIEKKPIIPTEKSIEELEKAAKIKSRHNKIISEKIDDILEEVDGEYVPYRKVISKEYKRDSDISQYIKRRAQGYCEYCNNLGPFELEEDIYYLESHHVEFLSEGGIDVLENIVALCPSCHRKAHYGYLKRDEKNEIVKKVTPDDMKLELKKIISVREMT